MKSRIVIHKAVNVDKVRSVLSNFKNACNNETMITFTTNIQIITNFITGSQALDVWRKRCFRNSLIGSVKGPWKFHLKIFDTIALRFPPWTAGNHSCLFPKARRRSSLETLPYNTVLYTGVTFSATKVLLSKSAVIDKGHVKIGLLVMISGIDHGKQSNSMRDTDLINTSVFACLQSFQPNSITMYMNVITLQSRVAALIRVSSSPTGSTSEGTSNNLASIGNSTYGDTNGQWRPGFLYHLQYEIQ